MKKMLRIGPLTIGGTSPVRVESMLKIPLSRPEDCLVQCDVLEKASCELVRVAFPSSDLSGELRMLNNESPLPLMADIHFDPTLALAALEAGVPSIRINPGNMARSRLRDVVRSARERNAVIRIGANGGSLNAAQLARCRGVRSDGLAAAVEEQLHLLLDEGFDDIILSAKSSSIPDTLRANALLSTRYPDFPLHIGITESGSGSDGLIKSAAGLALLLGQGVGDTIRVSLTEPPEVEVAAGFSLLRALGLRKKGVTVISCPTCGRRRIDVRSLLDSLSACFEALPDDTTVAVMGCEVNGPQEARGADFGIAGTATGVAVFRKGEILRNVTLQEVPAAVAEFASEIREEKKKRN